MNRRTAVLQDGGARFARVWSIVSASSLIATVGWSQTLTWLGTLGGVWSEAYGVSADGSVVVGMAFNAAGQNRAFRWTQAGMEDLNQTYASLLAGSRLLGAFAISPDGRYIVGAGINAATSGFEAFLLDTGSRCASHNGDVDNNGCVDDADLLAVLFAFGNAGGNLGRVDVNCDQTVDDADLLQVLFNFGSGC
jgi:probable HAF family extracellular repeat protein